jgi:hypothetical protein
VEGHARVLGAMLVTLLVAAWQRWGIDADEDVGDNPLS